MPLDRSTYPHLSASLDSLVASATPPWSAIAQALNFLSENRTPRIADFSDDLEAEFSTANTATGATSFLDTVHPKLRPPSSTWLDLIESPLNWDEGYTYLSFRDINNYLTDVPLTSPPPRIILTKPLKFNVMTSSPVKRFIWVTDSSSLSMITGNDVVKELGLSHYRADDVIYRVKLSLSGRKLFVPTALDAETGEAWSFPHDRDPLSCGFTRHLENGALRCPELLTEVSSHVGEKLVADLAGTLPEANVGPYALDFLAGRPVQDISGYMI